jgi:hypothetical protein
MKSSSDKNNPRVLLCLSDGEHFYRNCLAPVTVRDIFEKEMINAFSVIKIEKLQIYPIKSKKFIFISKVTAVSDGNKVIKFRIFIHEKIHCKIWFIHAIKKLVKVNSAIGNPQEYVVPNALITVPSKLPEKPVGEVGIVKSFPIESVSILWLVYVSAKTIGRIVYYFIYVSARGQITYKTFIFILKSKLALY